jgi:hypothetical protein
MKLVILLVYFSHRTWHGLCFNNIKMTIESVVGEWGLLKGRDIIFLVLNIGRRYI